MTHTQILTPNTPTLGFGAMRLPDLDLSNKMVNTYMSAGYNYFDTAYAYEGSEELLKNTLVKHHPRNSYMIANKLPPWELKKPADSNKILEESLKRCGLDYFDFYLLHSLSDDRQQHIENMNIFEWAFEQKKRGVLKHVGFSFHGTSQYLDSLLTRYPQTEFVQLQLNYVDILQGQGGQWHAIALKHNKPIIVMGPIKGGSLAALPPSAEALLKAHDSTRTMSSWAMQYAASLEGVTSILSGMSTQEQVEDNLKTFANLKPLTPEEHSLLKAALVEMGKVSNIACTACKYCHKYCPQGIDIATSFSLYNELKRGSAEWNRQMLYGLLDPKPSVCTACGLCLEHCPQHLSIPKDLQVVASEFGK